MNVKGKTEIHHHFIHSVKLGHVNSIERDRNGRYFSQVSILYKETSVSMIRSIWYRYRSTLINTGRTSGFNEHNRERTLYQKRKGRSWRSLMIASFCTFASNLKTRRKLFLFTSILQEIHFATTSFATLKKPNFVRVELLLPI